MFHDLTLHFFIGSNGGDLIEASKRQWVEGEYFPNSSKDNLQCSIIFWI